MVTVRAPWEISWRCQQIRRRLGQGKVAEFTAKSLIAFQAFDKNLVAHEYRWCVWIRTVPETFGTKGLELRPGAKGWQWAIVHDHKKAEGAIVCSPHFKSVAL